MKKSKLSKRVKRIVEAFYILTFTFTTSQIVQAQNITSSASGNWNSASTWSTGTIPTSSDDVEIGSSGNHSVTIDTDAVCKDLTINSTSTVELNSSETLTISGDLSNAGVLDFDAGSCSVSLAGTFTNTGTMSATGSGAASTFTLNGNSGTQTISNTTVSTVLSHSVSTTIALPNNRQSNGDGIWPSAAMLLTQLANNDVVRYAIDVNTPYTYTAISSLVIYITHTYNRDIDIYLVTPSDTSYIISTDNGWYGDGYAGATFTDTAATDITSLSSVATVISGYYRPEHSFASYSGPFVGTWYLYVKDDGPGEYGSLTGLTLNLEGDGTPDIAFDNFVMDNSSGNETTVTNTDILVRNSATFTNGIVNMGANHLTFSDGVSSPSISDTSYIDGQVRKYGDDAFTFPVGDDGYAATIGISAPAKVNDYFTAQYFHIDPNNAGYSTSSLDAALNHVSLFEYWTLDRSANSTSSASVTTSYATGKSGTIGDETAMHVSRWDGTQWDDHGPASGGGSGGMVTSTSVSSFGQFTNASANNTNALPIELVSFSARLTNENSVKLDWQTATEINNSFFAIERWKNTSEWEEINRIPGAGNSSTMITYSTTDHNPYFGTSYYRLKQTDFDGAYSYSAVKAVVNAATTLDLVVFPNPAKNYITLAAGEMELKQLAIYDVLGQNVSSLVRIVQPSETTARIDISRLAAGTYFVKTSAAAVQLQKH